MKSSLKEAELLIEEYFKAFPSIKRVLDSLGMFGLKNGYIQTIAPFYRKRWFPFWKYAKSSLTLHLQKIEYNATLGSIERAAKNHPRVMGCINRMNSGNAEMPILSQAI